MLLLFGFCIQGFAEELLFKGYIMNTIASMSNMTIGIVINSVIFSLNHAINPNVTSIGLICVLQDLSTQYCKEKVHTFAPEIFL
jgi:membrane protease YdiL (CAAX protease family)